MSGAAGHGAQALLQPCWPDLSCLNQDGRAAAVCGGGERGPQPAEPRSPSAHPPCTWRLQASPATSLHPFSLLPIPPTQQLRIFAVGG